MYVYVFYDRWLKASPWLGIPLWMEVFSLVKIICNTINMAFPGAMFDDTGERTIDILLLFL